MASCTITPAPIPEPDPLDQHFRGGMGILSPEEAGYMQHLAWPQTYTDMVGTFGLAHQSTATADIYRVQGSDKRVWVYYSGTQATRFEIK